MHSQNRVCQNEDASFSEQTVFHNNIASFHSRVMRGALNKIINEKRRNMGQNIIRLEELKKELKEESRTFKGTV